MTKLKNTIRLEELSMMLLSLYGLYFFNAAWWYYPLLFLGPDISMLGYFAGNRTGAFIYNLFHHKAVAVLILIAGVTAEQQLLTFAGIILFGHSSMDRFFGYGLKLNDGFKFTHLGKIGKPQ